jgi:hypothetical protein
LAVTAEARADGGQYGDFGGGNAVF